MAANPSPDFQVYLQAIRLKGVCEAIAGNEKYQRWENSYTSTDTVSKQREFFDMGLMVPTWQPKQPKGKLGEEKPEKIERLDVLKKSDYLTFYHKVKIATVIVMH